MLGFPVQLVGLLTLPYLVVRWYVDGNDAAKDLEDAAVSGIITLCGSSAAALWLMSYHNRAPSLFTAGVLNCTLHLAASVMLAVQRAVCIETRSLCSCCCVKHAAE